jgi:hypothetical protein
LAIDDRPLIDEERERVSRERNRIADERDRLADERDRLADEREQRGGSGEQDHGLAHNATERAKFERPTDATRATESHGRPGDDDRPTPTADWEYSWEVDRRDFVADHRQEVADQREALADERERLLDERDERDPSSRGEQTAWEAERSEDRARRAARVAAATAREVADRKRAATTAAGPLAAEFVKMARALIQSETVELAMTEVVEAAVRFVHGCDEASFSAYVDDVVTTIASSGPVAESLDSAQYLSADGPCLQAIRTLQLVISDDLSSDDRWPAFTATVGGRAGSVMSSPVTEVETRSGEAWGALNTYGMSSHAFRTEDADTAMLMTAHLGVLLKLAQAAQVAKEQAQDLAVALTTRDVIGQAKGILMEREGLTAGQAFDVLRRASQRLNRKLRDVADQVTRQGELGALGEE